MFTIDSASCAIMMSYYHLLEKVGVAKAAAWSIAEVFERWRIFQAIVLIKKYLAGNLVAEEVIQAAEKWLKFIECDLPTSAGLV